MNIVEVRFDNNNVVLCRNNNDNVRNNITVLVNTDKGVQFGKIVNIFVKKKINPFLNIPIGY